MTDATTVVMAPELFTLVTGIAESQLRPVSEPSWQTGLPI